jgi:integrase
MPTREAPVYRRGKYWLDKLRREDGSERSPRWYIFHYDPEKRREASVSTGTTDADEATVQLDRCYLNDKDETPAFCHACGQPLASADAYLLSDAIADYRLEHGDLQRSADSIKARLDHVVDFLEAEEARSGGVFGLETSCAAAAGNVFVTAFRAWSRERPVQWRNKAGDVTVSRPRAAATTEESVLQVAAALNHAVDADPPRSEKRPVYRPLPRKQVSRPRRHRVEVPVLADIVGYAAEPNQKRASLHAFVVASLCTIARPDSVVDICVAPDREQWFPGAPTLDLNPFGRAQTNKFRPTIPVVPVLDAWMTSELVAYQRLDPAARKGAGYLVNYYGRPVSDVDTAWRTMLRNLKLPQGREWKAYLLRHSLATILRNRGVAKWDLEGFMGHDVTGSTETYAIGRFATVYRAIEDILGEIDLRVPGALRRNCAEVGSAPPELREVRMSG